MQRRDVHMPLEQQHHSSSTQQQWVHHPLLSVQLSPLSMSIHISTFREQQLEYCVQCSVFPSSSSSSHLYTGGEERRGAPTTSTTDLVLLIRRASSKLSIDMQSETTSTEEQSRGDAPAADVRGRIMQILFSFLFFIILSVVQQVLMYTHTHTMDVKCTADQFLVNDHHRSIDQIKIKSQVDRCKCSMMYTTLQHFDGFPRNTDVLAAPLTRSVSQ